MNLFKAIFSSIWQALKISWKAFRKFQSVVGTLLFLALVIFLGATLFQGARITVPEGGALVVSLEGAIQEQETYRSSPFQGLSVDETRNQTLLRNVTMAIDHAAEDDRIRLLIIDTKNMGRAMPSQLHHIGEAMTRFRQSGKKIVTYGDNFTQGAYLVASYADEIYLSPFGAVVLHGYDFYQNYFKGFIDKIKAEMQLFRVGKYKSAMENYTRDSMSPEAREASLALLTGLWGEYTDAVTTRRRLDKDKFIARFETVDHDLAAVNGDLAQLALGYGLVDDLKTREEWYLYLTGLLQVSRDKLPRKIIFHRDYLQINGLHLETAEGQVAVVYANGPIVDGQHPPGVAGGETVSRHLREVRLNEDIKAVVLRVNSPGGSAYASELIRQEVLLLKAAGKPVIVSMGALAASGGYWISANADEIWATPTTITGSIGIFGAIPNFEGTLAAIGVTTDGVGTTPLSVAGVSRPLPDKVKAIIQSSIEHGYARFLQIVAEGRNMKVADVHEIAQGRVWSGSKALELGLVDSLGYFDEAVRAAGQRAGLKDFKVVYWEDPIPWDVKLVSQLLKRHTALGDMLMAKVGRPQDILAAFVMDKLAIFRQLNDPNHAYVLCLSCMDAFMEIE